MLLSGILIKFKYMTKRVNKIDKSVKIDKSMLINNV